MVIEWNKDIPFGPSKEDRFPKEDAISMIRDKGFELEKEIDCGSYHYGLVFKKV